MTKIYEDLIQFNTDVEALWIEIARLIYTFQNGEYQLKEIKPPKEKKEHIDMAELLERVTFYYDRKRSANSHC